MAESGGFPPGGIGALFEQAQQMARRLQEKRNQIERELAGETVEASAGGGMVSVTASADGRVRQVRIDKSVVDPEDVEMLQDLVQAATNEALRRAAEVAEKKRSSAMGGLPLPPGLDLSSLFGK